MYNSTMQNIINFLFSLIRGNVTRSVVNSPIIKIVIIEKQIVFIFIYIYYNNANSKGKTKNKK